MSGFMYTQPSANSDLIVKCRNGCPVTWPMTSSGYCVVCELSFARAEVANLQVKLRLSKRRRRKP